MTNIKLAAAAWVIGLFLAGILGAAEPGVPNVTIETVYTGLDRPCGVAVQPSTGNVIVSESGAGHVVRFLQSDFGKPQVAVKGFPLSSTDKGILQNVGPLGLAFLHQNLIVVGASQRKEDGDTIRVYELPSDPKKGPLNFKDAKKAFGRTSAGEGKESVPASLWGLAMTPAALWITSQGEGNQDAILKANVAGNMLDEPVPFLQSGELAQFSGPMGVAIRNSREYLVVGFVGKLDSSRDSVLAFIHSRSRGLMMALPTELHDLVALAYSPQSNRLYAVDLAWGSPKDGGLYRLDSAIIDGRAGMKAIKLASLDRPTALAFAPDNTLYITAVGTEEASEQDAAKKGVLVKVTGDL